MEPADHDSIKEALDEALAEARALQSAQRPAEAASKFEQASELMLRFANSAPTRDDQSRRMRKAGLLQRHAQDLRSSRKPSKSSARSQTPSREPIPDSEVSEDYSAAISGLIHRSSVTWDQIGGLEDTKREIKFTYGLAMAHKPEGVRMAGWRRMLFYGPPGTGKTLLAAAASNGLNATFFNVRVSSLLSKYFGESPKLISELFDAARGESDEGFAVVFIDEVDSLCLQRGGGSETGAERRVLSTLLSELDGLADKGEDRFVLTIAATNAPWDLDDAVLSRFQKRIYIPLPDETARNSILDILLTTEGHTLDFELDEIVARTKGFSGRDLERVAHQAANKMVEELNAEIPALVDQGRHTISSYRLKTRPLMKKDFDSALESIKVDVARQEELKRRHQEFAEAN